MIAANFFKAGITAAALTGFCALANAQIDTAALSARLSQPKEKQQKNLVCLVYKDGKMLYKKEMGEYTIKSKVPVDASSQWLTTALVMTFVQEGKLSLDDKVSTYLPILNKYYKGFITLRHCLTHFTGIQADPGVVKLLQKNKFSSLEAEVDNFISRHDIQTNAGTEFRYSNIGFEIAGRVLEIVSKRTFDRLMQDRLTRPLAMKNTTFTSEDYNDGISPAIGASSSAADFTNFLGMLLNKGSFNGKQILTEASVETMHTLTTEAAQVKYAPKTVESLNYGLGEWILETNAQGKASAVTVPSLQGSWPVIDLCRGYSLVLFMKGIPVEQSRTFISSLKTIIDDGLGGSCQ